MQAIILSHLNSEDYRHVLLFMRLGVKFFGNIEQFTDDLNKNPRHSLFVS